MADFFKKFGEVGQWDDLPQLNAIAPAKKPSLDTTLITLTLGGNDSNFARVLRDCLDGVPFSDSGEAKCLQDSPIFAGFGQALLANGGRIIVHPSKDPIPGTTWDFCDNKCAKNSPADKVVTVPSLGGLLEQIHTRAPNAKIRVPLYTRLFDSNPTDKCIVGTFAGGSVRVSVSAKSAKLLNNLANQLNDTIIDQVNQTRPKGVDVTFVDPNTDALDEHHLCGSGTPWFNAIRSPKEFSFHPNADGQRYLADLVKNNLTHGES